jgi:hypothetical protein
MRIENIIFKGDSLEVLDKLRLEDVKKRMDIFLKVKSIKLPKNFDEEIFNILPVNIVELIFDDTFNKPISFYPRNIKKITFGWYFNQVVNNLPEKLEEIHFNGYFNQELDNLPLTVNYITLGAFFDKKLDLLPLGLRVIHFGRLYSHQLENLPMEIEKIYISNGYVYIEELKRKYGHRVLGYISYYNFFVKLNSLMFAVLSENRDLPVFIPFYVRVNWESSIVIMQCIFGTINFSFFIVEIFIYKIFRCII